MNTYTVIKAFNNYVIGDTITATADRGAKLIRQGLVSLTDNYDNEQVQLRWRNEGLEIFNRQTGAVLLRIPPTGLASLTVDIVGDVTGTTTTAERLRKVTPKNAKAAGQTIGAGQDGEVTVTAAVKGVAGNDLDIIVSDAGAADCAMTADIAAGVITVTLGKTAAALEPIKNTATLVAAAINLLTEVTAVASGTGDDPLVAAEVSQDFVGGQDGTVGYEGETLIDTDRIYVCTADNTALDANWVRTDALSTF